MASIDQALAQLEKSADKIRKLSIKESKAVEKAVKESSETARARVEDEYASAQDSR